MTTATTDYKDGWLVIRDVENLSDEPIQRITYWPVSQGSKAWLESMDFLGKEALYDGGGTYRVRIAPYTYRTCSLAEYGNTKAMAVENVPLPAPKVRKGIEIRYRDSRWQKYLKSEGWVTI